MRVLFFGITAPDKSMRDVPYIKALKEKGVIFLECYDTSPRLKKYIRLIQKFWPQRRMFDVVWIGHTSALAVPLARLLTRKPILYNALCPLYDGLVEDRKTFSPYSLRAMLIWLVDFLAFHCASAILLETNAQIANVARMFFVPWRKMYRVWTTVEPEYYHPDPSVQKDPIWTCTFRAWLTPATGTEYIVEAARLLKRENIHFRFLVKGPLVDELRQLVQKEGLKHIEIDSKRYEFDELNQLILRGHIFLGQFSDHPRTARTIQFKTVEACALGLPYITADLPSNRELLTPGRDCLFVHPRNGEELAEKILTLKRDPQLRELLGRAAHELYRRELDPKILAERIFGIMQGMR